MLDILKTTFKSVNKMNFNESKTEVNSQEVFKTFVESNRQLAIKGNNEIKIDLFEIKEKFEVNISLFKRIINNLISNALKHTKDGNVKLAGNTRGYQWR